MEDIKHGRKRKLGNLIPEGMEDGKCNDWNQLLNMKGFLRPVYYTYIIHAFQRNRMIAPILSGFIVRELIVRKKQTFRYMDFVFQNAAEEGSGFSHLLKHSGQSGADFRRVYSKMDSQKLVESLAHPNMRNFQAPPKD